MRHEFGIPKRASQACGSFSGPTRIFIQVRKSSRLGWRRRDPITHRRFLSVFRTFLASVCFALIGLSSSGCYCTRFVGDAGVHKYDVYQKAYWTDEKGNFMVECQVTDVRETPWKKTDLGTRFVCASPEVWRNIATEEMKRLNAVNEQILRGQDKDRLASVERSRTPEEKAWAKYSKKKIFVLKSVQKEPVKESDLFLSDKLVFYPSGLKNYQKATFPPGTWRKSTFPNLHEGSTDGFIMEIEHQAYYVCFDLYTKGDDDVWRKPVLWGLIVPAIATDIVTAPIQFFIVMGELAGVH